MTLNEWKWSRIKSANSHITGKQRKNSEKCSTKKKKNLHNKLFSKPKWDFFFLVELFGETICCTYPVLSRYVVFI